MTHSDSQKDSQGLTLIHSDSQGLTKDSQGLTLIHSDSQNTRKTHTIRKAPGPKTPGNKTTLQQRKQPQNTHETHSDSQIDSQGHTLIHSDSQGLTKDSQGLTLIHSDSQNTRKTHTIRKAPGPKTPGNKTTLQQRKQPQNTHETQTTQRDHHTGTLSSSTRSRIIGRNSKSSNF